MSKIIPNENTWVGFATTVADIAAPTEAEVAAAIPLTHLLISINATATGNMLPTPQLDSLYELSIPGTVQAQFTADFYRDDDPAADVAWTTLPRGTSGYMIVSRFGGSGTNQIPEATDTVEVWPIKVTSRAIQNMASNAVITFQVIAAVPEEPSESSTVAA